MRTTQLLRHVSRLKQGTSTSSALRVSSALHARNYSSAAQHAEDPSSSSSFPAAAALGAAVGGLGTLLLSYSWASQSVKAEAAKTKPAPGSVISGLPEYTRKDVEKHATDQDRIWVTYKDGVYDITDFVDAHPGGRAKITLAAGADIGPFWAMYQQHANPQVHDLLEELRVGNLAAADRSTKIITEDPYKSEPQRHRALIVRSQKPFNAEVPYTIAAEQFNTPNEFFYVRNHLPVPKVDAQEYELTVTGEGAKLLKLSLDDLKTKFKKHYVTSTVQCAGNRRNEMTRVKPVKGGEWEFGAISNATWAGAKLSDVLAEAGVDLRSVSAGVQHIQFEGLDKDISSVRYGASIPADKALNPLNDVILAYEMNGEELPADHGYPVRVVVPGVVGARQVKWLSKIVTSMDESPSHWQQADYKAFSPNVDWDNVDWKAAPSIQDCPITSAICEPQPGTHVPAGTDELTVRGYAYSGGGKGVIRVDVSGDGGKTWHTADLIKPKQPPGRVWAWTQWKVDIPLPKDASGKLELCCKAVDESYNTQPEFIAPIWNLRGVINNAWHRVPVLIEK